MYLFIFETIGTQELLLVAVVALIFFGPRKLPEMMRSFGKAMTEFRRSTNEFKQSWEREASLEDFTKEPESKPLLENKPENSIGGASPEDGQKVVAPEIKELDQETIRGAFPGVQIPEHAETEPVKSTENSQSDATKKENWL